jgi:hypothetical protein
MGSITLSKKVKTALDETRLLILGAQVLFGSHFNRIFRTPSDVAAASAPGHMVGLVLIMVSIGLRGGRSSNEGTGATPGRHHCRREARLMVPSFPSGCGDALNGRFPRKAISTGAM